MINLSSIHNHILIKYLKIRSNQLVRSLREVGVIRGSFLFFLVCFFFVFLQKLHIQYLPLCLYMMIIYIHHSSRKDKEFLKLNISSHTLLIYWCEYFIISIPFALISLLNDHGLHLLFYIVFILITPFLFVFQMKIPKLDFPFFRKGSYEFQIMFKHNYMALLACYFIGFLGIYNGNERVLYVFSAILGILWLSFLINTEPLHYIVIFRSSKDLLANKIYNILYNSIILYFPFILMGLFFGSECLGTVLLLYVTLLLVSISFNMLKYCLLGNKFVVSLYGVLGIIPLGIVSVIYPLATIGLLFLNLLLIIRASEKLEIYFRYDQNI